MTLFWILATGMLAVALLLLLPPLLRREIEVSAPERGALNTAIFRQKLAEMDADRQRGALSDEDYEQAKQELERSLLDDLSDEGGEAARRGTSRRWVTAIILAVALPAVVLPLYLHYGHSELVGPTLTLQELVKQGGQKSLDYAANRLVEHVRSHPDDGRAWELLGRAYMGLNRYSDAVIAFRHLYKLEPNNADVMVAYAESIAMSQGDDLKGHPTQLLAQALQKDSTNRKALWLTWIGLYRDGQYGEAIKTWQRLSAQLTAGSDAAKFVQKNIDRAVAAEKAAATAGPAAGGASVQVRVTLDPRFAAKVAPNTTVFVFAKAVQGPPMPLAIKRLQVKDLPVTVTLDDSLSMAPVARISKFKRVMLSARVSNSGRALPESGDLEGQTGPVPVGGNTVENVRIDKVIP